MSDIRKIVRKVISENKELVSEDVKLVASQGRSDGQTLSWYVEEYLLNLGTDVLNHLDNMVKSEKTIVLSISKSASKMVSNTLVTKLIISGIQNNKKINEDFTLSISVNLEQNANTSVSVTTKGITNHINLTSKHSEGDLSLFKDDVANYIINSIKIKEQI